MSSELMRRTAAVLEKTADYLDAEDQRQRDVVRTERRQVAQTLSEKYAAATGEELPPGSVEKLAASDKDLLTIFEKIAARTTGTANGAPDDMGTPSDRSDRNDRGTPAPATGKYHDGQEKRAAVEDADARFVDWINS
jgi:hypothetical protein